MILPADFEQRIGFDKIRELIAAECQSSLGLEILGKLKVSDRPDMVEKLINQTDEFLKILQSGEHFPSGNYIDVRAFLSRAKVTNAFFTEDEFFDLKKSLGTLLSILDFFNKHGEEYPHLMSLRNTIQIDSALYKAIDDKIDDEGKVRNNASRELMNIRSELFKVQAQLRKTVESVYRKASQNQQTPEDASVTIRDGRLVIPILSEYKRRVKGFIHDQSATGQTVYIEPAEALELNNDVRDLEYRERREIVKILTALTQRVEPHIQELEKCYKFLGLMDFIRAKARFAQRINAFKPLLQLKAKTIKLRKAQHPLLTLSMQKQGKEIVPLALELDADNRILIISGPNAGGKSVALKTVGLLQYMFQCGLLVPANPDSEMCVFKNIFIDIGDQQSIENDLSTYSSHLSNMREFMMRANKNTLFLIDEFGTGTEPRFGGAVAESILENLHQQKAYGIITTHYDNVKNFALHHQNVISGAMKFDERKLEPLYELEIGKPGSSFALEVAAKMGIPSEVLKKAKGKIGTERVNYDKLLNQLGKERKELESRLKEAAKKEEELTKNAQEYQELKEFVESNKNSILKKAKSEAQQIVKDANKLVEQTIREIKESEAENKKTKSARKKLEDFKERVKTDKREVVSSAAEKDSYKKIDGSIQAGDYVRISDQDTIGEVISVKGKQAEVMLGELKSTIKLNRLERLSKRQAKQKKSKSQSGTSTNVISKSMNFNPQIDVRGMRSEEAIKQVDNLIDDAMVLGYNEVRILHGRGDGILRKVIRDYIKQYPYVGAIKNEHEERGGDGISIVMIK